MDPTQRAEVPKYDGNGPKAIIGMLLGPNTYIYGCLDPPGLYSPCGVLTGAMVKAAYTKLLEDPVDNHPRRLMGLRKQLGALHKGP